jgi:hypothetical protein
MALITFLALSTTASLLFAALVLKAVLTAGSSTFFTWHPLLSAFAYPMCTAGICTLRFNNANPGGPATRRFARNLHALLLFLSSFFLCSLFYVIYMDKVCMTHT